MREMMDFVFVDDFGFVTNGIPTFSDGSRDTRTDMCFNNFIKPFDEWLHRMNSRVDTNGDYFYCDEYFTLLNKLWGVNI